MEKWITEESLANLQKELLAHHSQKPSTSVDRVAYMERQNELYARVLLHKKVLNRHPDNGPTERVAE